VPLPVQGSEVNLKRIGLLAVAVVIILCAITQALPQTISLFSTFVCGPCLARTEFTVYADDGSTVIDSYFVTSYLHRGGEVALSTTFPGCPLRTAARRVIDAIGAAHYLLTGNLRDGNEGDAPNLKDSCTDHAFPVVAVETILNRPTVASQETSPQDRITMWRAADLACYPLRVTKEDRRPDGRFVLRMKRQTIEIDKRL
jgi:hypothetical protein